MGEDAAGGLDTILVADDNEANRALARSTLEDEGYRVVLAYDGEESVAAFTRERPACVLLDIRMPGVDGLSACERIRALPGGAETPVIFLTALRDVDTFDRALAVGGNDFLTKPVRPAELVARIDAALKLRRMRVELHEHYELLRHQRDALLRVQLQKERLMAFVVHDLKNPVNSMDLHAQILFREKDLSSGGRESVMHIRNEARQLGRLILNLLDISKGDEGKLNARKTDVDLSALAADLLGDLAANAEARHVTLKASIGVERVRADQDLLRRLLMNLVDNALRHAPPNTTVEVSSAPCSGGVVLRVADEGPGIPDALKERIFDAFVQSEGNGPSLITRSGRGLGLAFCHLAVTAHGGRIWVEDGDRGAVFHVHIPEGDTDA